ncbi:MAG: DUF2325 domain-containing protein [Ruminococcaceae bacterium]|nr:DUF2325 domain-containing protein [Oscillospiraceae bacterium]
MSVVIVGGNECMVRQYKELCAEYRMKAKIYPKMNGGLRGAGTPELLVLFTNTMSHKMVNYALAEICGKGTRIARCHTSSLSALKKILAEHTEMEFSGN